MSATSNKTFSRRKVSLSLSMDSGRNNQDSGLEVVDSMDILRQARQAVKLADQKSDILQHYTTSQLMHRLKDLKYWAHELEREIQELSYENSLLKGCKENLQQAVFLTKDAAKVNEDSIQARKFLTFDSVVGKTLGLSSVTVSLERVARELLSEKNYIENVTKFFNKMLQDVTSQIDQNKTTKSRLLKDWNMKQEALQLDTKSAGLPVEGVDTDRTLDSSSRYVDGTLFEHREWLRNCQSAINQSNKERANTKKLVQIISNKLRETGQGLRNRATQVEAALKDHIKQMTQKTQSWGGVIKGQEKELMNVETAIEELTICLTLKQTPLKVALGRFDQRVQRPGLELCDDRAQQALNNEINILKQSINALQMQLDKAQSTKAKILNHKTKTSNQRQIIFENLQVEMEILRNIRSNYPVAIQINGFVKKNVKKYTD